MAARPLVAFDLDGTLTHRDCVVPFLRRVAGAPRLAGVALRRASLLAAARRDRERRDDVKAAFVHDLLTGRPAADVEAAGERFAEELAGGALRPDVVARLRWHLDEGHEVVVVTASFAAYAAPLAARLGAHHTLATELEVGADGRLTGRLAGANCRGGAKLRRLRAQFGDDVALSWAYGDSPDDAPMLGAAAHPQTVGRDMLTPSPA